MVKLSRPVVIALVGLVLAVGLFLYTRSSGDSEVPKPPSADPVANTSSGNAGSSTDSSAGTINLQEATPQSITPPVAAALTKGKVIVMLFWRRGDPEDESVKRAVEEVARKTSGAKVAVFSDSPLNVAKYSLIAQAVTRSPAVVIVGRDLKARTVQGYVDESSILQLVKEANQR